MFPRQNLDWEFGKTSILILGLVSTPNELLIYYKLSLTENFLILIFVMLYKSLLVLQFYAIFPLIKSGWIPTDVLWNQGHRIGLQVPLH